MNDDILSDKRVFLAVFHEYKNDASALESLSNAERLIVTANRLVDDYLDISELIQEQRSKLLRLRPRVFGLNPKDNIERSLDNQTKVSKHDLAVVAEKVLDAVDDKTADVDSLRILADFSMMCVWTFGDDQLFYSLSNIIDAKRVGMGEASIYDFPKYEEADETAVRELINDFLKS